MILQLIDGNKNRKYFPLNRMFFILDNAETDTLTFVLDGDGRALIVKFENHKEKEMYSDALHDVINDYDQKFIINNYESFSFTRIDLSQFWG